MTQLEFQAKSVKKAVAKASKELKIDAADLNYQINSYGSSGIFGLVGARKAKISVNIPEETPDKPARKSHSPKKKAAKKPPPTDKTDPSESPKEAKSDLDPKSESELKPEPKPELKKEIKTDLPEEKPPAVEQIPLDEVIEYGQGFLKHLVDAITPDTTVLAAQDKNKISYEVTDGNQAILIGKHGQTLEALQYLTEKAVNRKIEQRIIVEVDVAGYHAKRRENLIDQARRMADKAAKTGKSVTIGPMSPQDRRVVHITLKPDRRVRTQSIGKGITRKLTIHPKKRRQQKKRKSSQKQKQD